jgi:hypothetical protein
MKPHFKVADFKIGDKVRIHPKFKNCDWYTNEIFTITDLNYHYFSDNNNGKKTIYATLDKILLDGNSMTISGLCSLKEERKLKIKKITKS